MSQPAVPLATDAAVHDAGSPPGAAAETRPAINSPLGVLVLGALGVVYGDIGTSPLYTLKTAYEWAGGATPQVALGLLSLIFWTLIITTSIKYVALVMRADNDGEGGILALTALIGMKHNDDSGRGRTAVIAMGILGGALLYGDGAITPAISVLSALEGLKEPLPRVTPYVLPLAVAILVGLFLLQQAGTAVIGRLFGPVMVLWFLAIGGLGLVAVAAHPSVLLAVDPRRGLEYLAGHGYTGFTVLGAVFLSATGAEALYADMGHFGARPIRLGWYGLVLPCLLLNYAGQTALVVDGRVAAGASPFFALAGAGLQLPMVALATLATIIASQAIISGVFSMTRQAIQLGLCPRMDVTQTSAEGYGQIYVAGVNWILMIFTVGLALSFGSSDRLAAAFGIAVALTMLLTTALMFLMMRERWHWSLAASVAVAGFLAVVDATFFAANLTKFFDGGWVPLLAAALVFTVMSAWRTGRIAMLAQLERVTMPLRAFAESSAEVPRVAGTAIYLARRADAVPLSLLHSLKHYHVLHQRNVVLNIETAQVPRIHAAKRVTVTPLGHEFFLVKMVFGFMEHPDLEAAFKHCHWIGSPLPAAGAAARPAMAPGAQAEDTPHRGLNLHATTFFVSRETIAASSHHARLPPWIRRLYVWMHRNAFDATEFYRLPRNRIVELGARIEL